MIIEQSNLYALQKNVHETDIISMAELKVFIDILIISGNGTLSSIKHFWKNSEDLRNVYNSIRRNRFEYIKKILHFYDNTNLNYDDKYLKLKPLIFHLQKAFMRHFISSQEISQVEYFISFPILFPGNGGIFRKLQSQTSHPG